MPLTKVSFSLINGAPFNVLDYSADPTGAADSTAAFTAALAAAAVVDGTVYVSTGTYKVTESLELAENCSLIFEPSVVIDFDSTDFHFLQVRRGTKVVGNGVTINCSNAAWDGGAIFLDGVDRFADDNPTSLSGITVIGNDDTKGTGLFLTATDAQDFISFVRFSNFSFYTLNYGMTLDCGTSGDPGNVNTWHWINSNTFDNFTFYATDKGFSAVGLNAVPAEVRGNVFNNFQYQVASPGVCAYFDGASYNTLSAYIWDWDYGLGDAIVFDGSAFGNQVDTNLEIGGVTAPEDNYVKTFSGTYSGALDIVNIPTISYTGNAVKFIFDDANKSYITNPREGLSNKLVLGTSNTDRLEVRQDGIIQFNAYGAGTLSTNASGVISASDGRFKIKTKDVQNGLALVNELRPTYYKWKEYAEDENGNEDLTKPIPFYTENEELGFIAQEVAEVIPQASSTPNSEQQYQNYSDRAIIAVLVKAVQELVEEVEFLKTKLS